MTVCGEDAVEEGDPRKRTREIKREREGEISEGGGGKREDRKRNRRSLAVRIISLFRALSFVESTWQYHCLSIKLKSLTPGILQC